MIPCFKEAWNPNERTIEMLNVVRRTFSTRICTIFVESEKIKIETFFGMGSTCHLITPIAVGP